jgi:hypothetical protein
MRAVGLSGGRGAEVVIDGVGADDTSALGAFAAGRPEPSQERVGVVP